MKNKILLLLVSFCVFQSNGQDLLKEITKTFENGKPMFIDYLEMEDLKKVKTEIFNESGTLIFSVQFNKDTGKYDGEFYDLINKGYFKDGVLNCNNCMLVEANKPSVYTYNHDRQNTLVTKGNVVNGRLTGKVERYTLHEGSYSKVDWESTKRYVDAGAGSGFRDVKTYRTGQFNKTQLKTFNYNSNGVLDGEQIFKYKNGEVRRAKLNFKNGIAKSKVTYDSNNLIIDSLFNENKIWKINKKFVKNDGFLVFSGLQKKLNGDYIVEHHTSGFYEKSKEPVEKLILLGGTQKIMQKNIYRKDMPGSFYYKERPFDTGGVPSGLNDNGLYTIHKTNNKFTKLFDSEIFFRLYNYLINNDMDQFRKIPKDVSIKDFLIGLKNITENNIVEIQKIYVWDSVLKKHVLFDFDKLIGLSDESRIKKVNSDYTTNYKNRIASIFEIDIKELEQYKNSYPYELLNLNKNSSPSGGVKWNPDNYVYYDKTPAINFKGEYKKTYGIKSLVGLSPNNFRLPYYPKAYYTNDGKIVSELVIDYIWILDFINEEALFKFISTKGILLKLNERKYYSSPNNDSYNPDSHTPELVYVDASNNRIGLKPTIGNFDLKNKRWYSVVNITSNSDNSTNEITKKPIENLELWYSSEMSSDFYLMETRKQLIGLRKKGFDIIKIEIHRVPGNEDATKAFTFYYCRSAHWLRKLEYLTSGNKSVLRGENNLLIVSNAKK